MTGGAVVPSAALPREDREDRLKDRKDGLGERIENQRGDVSEVAADLVDAQEAVDGAVGELTAAREQLTDARNALSTARARDREMQRRLDEAVVRLQAAREDLANGRADVSDQTTDVAQKAVATYQSGGEDLRTLQVALSSVRPEQVLNEMSTSSTVETIESTDLQELEATKVLLRVNELRVTRHKQEVQTRRQTARTHLRRTQTLETEAQTARDDVADEVEDLREVRAETAEAREEERERLESLQVTRDELEDELTEIAERRAERLAALQARQRRDASVPTPTSLQSSATGMAYPVQNSYITSPYGMRLHPILNVNKLHDGTDFGASCGTPVTAAADGTVTQAYFDAAYGNRVILDHGLLRDSSVWTSYNHLTSFSVAPGSSVRQGEVIGYAGTTGYSTGCHLHFMVYEGGATVDPMSWL